MLGISTQSNAQITAGYYTGDDTSMRLITLPFTPKAVIAVSSTGQFYINSGSGDYSTMGGVAVLNSNASGKLGTVLSVADNGFYVYHRRGTYSTSSTNIVGLLYNYIAFAF